MADETTPATNNATAISTYKVFLMKKGDSAYEKLIDIKSFPDLGGAPEMLETTTLSDKMQTYIAGIQSLDALEFEANYNPTDFAKLNALKEKTEDYAIWFGGTEANGTVTPSGDYGKFSFKGQLSAFVTGGGVNEVVGMTVTIAPSTPIEYNSAT
ncbi:MAG: phage tail protein [Ruminococcaceae bacterium]|nr:phage tail protein [Oscillospiraceae bacterium]